ncbi:MAG: DUF1127 domain-containing protein [Roseobacter sp.]|nr:DUF1127 domain-containing protein [Roseobacter sp.]
MNSTTDSRHICAPSAASKGPLRRLVEMWDLAQSRRALAQLTAAQRRDVGLTRAQAETEAKRPVWDVPQNWRR